MSYWINKEDRSKKALKHKNEMDIKYPEEIDNAVNHTLIYSPDTDFDNNDEHRYSKQTEIILSQTDSVSAIFKNIEKGKKIAVLNFASYKEPGGMFLKGSSAQEECLCHESILYNCLSQCNEFYDWNNKNKNRSLYLNRALYTPDVIFEKSDDVVKCDVITCAAPNKSSAQKYCRVSNEENSKVLDERIEFILNIANDNQVDILILGAFGSGVFGQDAHEVARLFMKHIEKSHLYNFDKVVFAVIKGRNYDLFKKSLLKLRKKA